MKLRVITWIERSFHETAEFLLSIFGVDQRRECNVIEVIPHLPVWPPGTYPEPAAQYRVRDNSQLYCFSKQLFVDKTIEV